MFGCAKCGDCRPRSLAEGSREQGAGRRHSTHVPHLLLSLSLLLSLTSSLSPWRQFFASIDTTGDHQNTLESFYKSQAGLYDKYRHRMLHGRTPMIMGMDAPKNGVWVDLGCGTVSAIPR